MRESKESVSVASVPVANDSKLSHSQVQVIADSKTIHREISNESTEKEAENERRAPVVSIKLNLKQILATLVMKIEQKLLNDFFRCLIKQVIKKEKGPAPPPPSLPNITVAAAPPLPSPPPPKELEVEKADSTNKIAIDNNNKPNSNEVANMLEDTSNQSEVNII